MGGLNLWLSSEDFFEVFNPATVCWQTKNILLKTYFPLRDSLTISISSLVVILVFIPFISRGERF
jgi:hypothetical protein